MVKLFIRSYTIGKYTTRIEIFNEDKFFSKQETLELMNLFRDFQEWFDNEVFIPKNTKENLIFIIDVPKEESNKSLELIYNIIDANSIFNLIGTL